MLAEVLCGRLNQMLEGVWSAGGGREKWDDLLNTN